MCGDCGLGGNEDWLEQWDLGGRRTIPSCPAGAWLSCGSVPGVGHCSVLGRMTSLVIWGGCLRIFVFWKTLLSSVPLNDPFHKSREKRNCFPSNCTWAVYAGESYLILQRHSHFRLFIISFVFLFNTPLPCSTLACFLEFSFGLFSVPVVALAWRSVQIDSSLLILLLGPELAMWESFVLAKVDFCSLTMGALS